MISIVLKWHPLSVQHIYGQRGRIRYMKKNAKLMKADYISQIIQQYSWETIETPVSIVVEIYFWDRRKRDWDNYHKLSMDSLEWTVLVNDNQIRKALVELYYDKENPRIEIDISPLSES